MIRHLFKLLWNRKKANFLMITEILISFIVLFVVTVVLIYHLGSYLKPLGFSYEDVWILSTDWKSQDRAEVKETLRQIENVLRSSPEVETFAYSQCLLFMPLATSTENYEYNGLKIRTQSLEAGDQFPEVLEFDMIEGRWFNRGDNAVDRYPIVINKYMKEELFPDGNALGKIVTSHDVEYEVIGVIGEFRNSGELSGSENVVFKRLSIEDEVGLKRLTHQPWNRILLRVKPGTGMQFEERLMKQLSSVARGWTLRMGTMEEARVSANKTSLVLPIILVVVCGFLMISVALGLFGVVWYNINRRRTEIGLRRALGAFSSRIYQQVLGEIMVLTTFGVALGSLFAIQFPLLNIISFIETGTYIIAFVISLILIYLMAAICALYPSWLAAKIHPAVALHNE